MSLGSLPAASPPFVGSVTASGDNTAVLLTLTSGPVGVRPSVFWVGASTTTTNWSDRLNWQLPGAPGVGDNVIFTGTAAVGGTPFDFVGDGAASSISPGTINNFVDTTTTVGSLTYSNVGGTFHNTLIANGGVLTVNSNGSLTVGSGSVDFGSGAIGTATIAGLASTLNVSNTNGTFFVGLGNASSQATLDLSGLGTLNATVSRFFVGVGSGSAGIPLARESGIVYLAQTNTITAGIAVGSTESSDTATNALAIDVGDDDGNAGASCFLNLGQTNAIFGDAIGVGRQKPTGTIRFNPNLTGNNTRPAAYFRGVRSAAIATFSVGDQVVNSGTTETANGTLDFTGGSVDARVNTMYVARSANNNTGSGTANGKLTFENGIFAVTTLYDGYQPTSSVKNAIGVINVNTNTTFGTSASLFAGTLNLGVTGGNSGALTTTGTLNIDGGTVAVGNVRCGTNGGTSTITVANSGNGGLLIVTNYVGSVLAPLSALNLNSSTLQLNVTGGVGGVPGVPAITANNVSAGGTTLNIGSIASATTGITYPLISYTGSDPFGGLTLGSLPAGAAGNLVDNSGVVGITFSSVPPSPGILTDISVNGTALTLQATNGTIGGQFVLLGTTNLVSPVWKPILTNNFDSNGNLNLTTNVLNPAVPLEFFRLRQ
jgi:hypothetical protein